VLLAAELLPLPRTLYPATVPTIYRSGAAAPEGTVVLHLPFGVRDGASSVGDFSAQTMSFQTAHGKTLMGGALSRVSNRRRRELRENPVLNALATLSEGHTLTAEQRQSLLARAPTLARESNLGFVVVDRSRASNELRDLAIAAFQLETVDSDGVFELLRPRREPGPQSTVSR
jgi:hypothetical protein